MLIESKLMKTIENKIIEICKNEIKVGNSEELLGVEIQYFYDGEFADIGFKIVIFDNDEDEGHSIYKSFMIDYQKIKESLLNIIDKEEESNKYTVVRIIAEEIKEHIEKIKWNNMIEISEELYFDLINYD